MKQKESISKLNLITIMMAGSLCAFGQVIFLKGAFIDIPKGTIEGWVIIFAGTTGILIISVLVSLGLKLALKKLIESTNKPIQN